MKNIVPIDTYLKRQQVFLHQFEPFERIQIVENVKDRLSVPLQR